MVQLPKGWSIDVIHQINEYKASSINPEKFPDETFELFSVPIFPTGVAEIIEGKSIGSTKQLVNEGDVLLCKINPRINRVWQVTESRGFRQIASSEWIVIRSTSIDSDYLTYFFREQKFRNLLCSDVSGVGGSLTRAKPKLVAEYNVTLAPFAEQTHIVEKLDEVLAQVDTIKARLDGIPNILKRFRQSVLASAVSGRLTEQWREGQEWIFKEGALGSFTDVDIGHAFKSKDFTEEGVALLRGQNIEPGSLRWIETKYIPVEKLEKHNHLFIETNDIILAMDRPIISSGLKLAKAKENDLPCVLVQRVTRFRPSVDVVNDYLYLLLSDMSFSNYLAPNQTGSDIPHISGKQILAYPINLPVIEEQTEIVRLVDQYFAFADSIEAQVDKARARVDKLTQSILAKAFRGELVPQDPNDEPADKLLEQIQVARQEAEALAKATKKADSAKKRTAKA